MSKPYPARGYHPDPVDPSHARYCYGAGVWTAGGDEVRQPLADKEAALKVIRQSKTLMIVSFVVVLGFTVGFVFMGLIAGVGASFTAVLVGVMVVLGSLLFWFLSASNRSYARLVQEYHEDPAACISRHAGSSPAGVDGLRRSKNITNAAEATSMLALVFIFLGSCGS